MTASLTETQIGAERCIRLGALTLVASASHPGAWHRVEHGACDCKGFQSRGRCRHQDAVAALEQPAEPDHQADFERRRLAEAASLPCEWCGRPATRLYGGKCSLCISNLD